MNLNILFLLISLSTLGLVIYIFKITDQNIQNKIKAHFWMKSSSLF